MKSQIVSSIQQKSNISFSRYSILTNRDVATLNIHISVQTHPLYVLCLCNRRNCMNFMNQLQINFWFASKFQWNALNGDALKSLFESFHRKMNLNGFITMKSTTRGFVFSSFDCTQFFFSVVLSISRSSNLLHVAYLTNSQLFLNSLYFEIVTRMCSLFW